MTAIKTTIKESHRDENNCNTDDDDYGGINSGLTLSQTAIVGTFAVVVLIAHAPIVTILLRHFLNLS